MSARICVVTAGQLSTCPRMLKTADALHEAGYRVRVVSVNHTPWATDADQAILATRGWVSTRVDYARTTARGMRLKTGARLRAAQGIAAWLGPSRVPMTIARRACSRAFSELVHAAIAEPADFIYGGSTGAIGVVASAAARLRVPYAIDLEDFHSAEEEGLHGRLIGALMERIERGVLPGARFLTAASPMMSAAYARKYGIPAPVTIYNTFSLDADRPGADAPADQLRVYWFSQTLGPKRGLETLIRAFGAAGVPGELHMRARLVPAYFETLERLQRDVAPALTLVPHAPAAPADMVRLSHEYDAGFSGEEPAVSNRELCLGNKIFTYLAAGVPVILSPTPAQAALAQELGDAAFVFDGERDLAHVVRDLATDPAKRRRARCAAHAAAVARWHWEHPADRGALLNLFRSALA